MPDKTSRQRPPRDHEYAGPVAAVIHLRGGGQLHDLCGYSDEVISEVDAGRERGERWVWLELNPPTDAVYSKPDPEPVAVAVDDVTAVSGIRRPNI